MPRQKYCESLHKTVRRKTRTVMVGDVALGSEHPIRIQTMTTSDTKDITATVEEVFESLSLSLSLLVSTECICIRYLSCVVPLTDLGSLVVGYENS